MEWGERSALAHDQLDTARSAALALAEAWHAVEAGQLTPKNLARWQGLVQWNFEAARELAGSEDAQTARQWLAVLTRSSLAAAEFGYRTERELGVYQCPMAFKNRGAIWIQERGGVENPYFGAMMFDCGSLREELAPR